MNSYTLSLWIEQNLAFFMLILIFSILWSFFWKGLALWKSSKLGHLVWFIIFLIFNTLGILEIIYLFFFSKKKKIKKEKTKK